MVQRVRAAVLIGFVEVGRFVGLDPFEELRRSKISPRLLENPENWLSATPVAELLERCAAKSGRSDFALLLAECRTFSSIGPVSLLLKHEASLKQIIARLGEFRRNLNEVFDLHLEHANCITLLAWTVAPQFLTPQTITLVAAVGYRAITDAMHGNWFPETVHFPFPRPKDTSTFERFFSGSLEFSSPFCGLSFPTSQLELENPVAEKALAQHAKSLLQLLPFSRERTTDQVKHALLLLLPNGSASLDQVARNLGVRPRSLQRELAQEGTTFAKVTNDTRRGLATLYLGMPGRSVSQIAHLTGYSSVSAFSRWFADQFGASPLAWRAKGIVT